MPKNTEQHPSKLIAGQVPRRTALVGMSAATLAGVYAVAEPTLASQASKPKPDIAVFAKHVQTMDFTELGRRLRGIGCQGIEATLRPGGQIEPKKLGMHLGRLVEALEKSEQRVLIAASNVNEVNADSEAYIKQLQKHEIPCLRMAYYKYDFSRPIEDQLQEFAKRAKQLSELCAAHGVRALYQNHAGRAYVGAALWDLLQVMEDVDPKGMAVALDIRHTTLELSQSYQSGYQAVRSLIGATYIKDFDWIDGKAQNVPLGEGRSEPLFRLMQRDGFAGPLSLHMEYTDHKDPSQVEASWAAIANDVATLHKMAQWIVT